VKRCERYKVCEKPKSTQVRCAFVPRPRARTVPPAQGGASDPHLSTTLFISIHVGERMKCERMVSDGVRDGARTRIGWGPSSREPSRTANHCVANTTHHRPGDTFDIERRDDTSLDNPAPMKIFSTPSPTSLHITVCRFLCLRDRGCVYAETCVYARGYVYAPAVYTYYRSRKRTYPRIRTRVRVRTRCVNAPNARVYTPTRVYAPGCVYAPAAYTHPPLA